MKDEVSDDILEGEGLTRFSQCWFGGFFLKIEKIFSLFDETNFSNWPSFKAEEDVYNNWKYGIETKDGKVFSNMVENLPENDQGWKLFTELFGFATHYPVMKK